MSLVLHPSLTQTIVELRRDLPQSLLLSGEKGAGLGTLARDLASQQLVQIVKPTDKDGVADELNGSISITEIRSLYESTRGKSKARRVIIIDDADRMTHSAQNAFLKLLEEPPELVHFILTAHSVEPLLPTIRSRVQHVHILPISDVQSGEIAEASPHRDQLLFIANGRPAELMRLLADNTYFSHESRRFRAAKTFLAASRYDRLIMITAISSRLEMLRFIDTLTVVARASLASTPRADTIQLLESLLATRQTLAANGNVKLQALRTVV